MLPVLLTPEHCLPCLSWPAAVEALRRGHALARPQQGDVMLGPDTGRLLCRAALIEGLRFAIKGDSVFPGNAAKGLPSIQGTVLLYDPDCGALSAVADLPQAVAEADIISAATMATKPVILGGWVRPGTHVDLIGAYTPDMREADDDLIAKARVYVDCTETVVDRIGEIMSPIQSGAISRDHIRGDLYDLVARAGSSRQSSEEITLFKNGGGAHLDLMIARYVFDAVQAGQGAS